jgi:hypothetical protein
MNRKNNSVKKLQEECKEKDIGYMTSWTKAALIKRLEDEDVRETDIIKLKNQLVKLEGLPEKKLENTKEELLQEIVQKKVLEERIKTAQDVKIGLGLEWTKSSKRIEELELLIKSLI